MDFFDTKLSRYFTILWIVVAIQLLIFAAIVMHVGLYSLTPLFFIAISLTFLIAKQNTKRWQIETGLFKNRVQLHFMLGVANVMIVLPIAMMFS